MTTRLTQFRHPWLAAPLFGVAFFGCAELGGLFSAPNHSYVSFWLPVGLFTGVLLLNETRTWPWFVLAALPANLLFDFHKGTPFVTTLGFFLADTSGVLLGAWLVRRFVAKKPRLATLPEYGKLLLTAALFSSLLGATLGAATLTASGMSPAYWPAWKTWWTNSAMAVSLLTPFILVWFSRPDPRAVPVPRRGRILEAVLLTAILTGLTWYLLVEDQGINAPYKSRLMPVLLWAGLRFGLRGATAANLWVALLLGFFTSHFPQGLTAADLASGDYLPTVQSFLAVDMLLTLIPTIVIQERNRKVFELQQSEERFRQLTEAAFEGICISENGRVLDMSDQGLKMLGYQRDEILGKTVTDLVAPASREYVAEAIRSGREYLAEHELLRKDGSVFSVEVRAKLIPCGNRTLRMSALRDITERKAQQWQITRQARLYTALSQINQAIVHSCAWDELYAQVCRILVEFGGFQSAWIGGVDPETRRVLPLAQFGDDGGHLARAVIYADDRPEGCGPTGRAIREGREYICNDFASDPNTLLWRESAALAGHKSSAVFPIRRQYLVCGAITVYSREPGFFQAQEIALLKEAALDVSFALDKLAEEEAHRQTEAIARNEKLFSDTMLESMPGILYFYDDQGRFLRWNRNFEQVTGYAGAEITGMHPLNFVPEQDQPLVQQRIAEVFERGESSVEARLLAKDGRLTPYFFTGRRIVLNGTACLVGVGIDITARQRAEMALRVLNQTLELEVNERTKELRAALVRAEAADRIKSAFLATMSHELRTPLNSIIGFTGVILQGLAGPLNAEQAKQLGMVRHSARHLLELINDVLDISKIEAGQLEVRAEPFDLRASLERVTALVQPLADKKRLTLSTVLPPEPGIMESDRRRVEQILINLLNNAIKFTDRGSVTLTVAPVTDYRPTPDAPPCPAVRLQVMDTGLGLRPEDVATLFQPFRQIDMGLARQHEGTGLGLVICRRLAALLGGEISVVSEYASGSTFTLTLPRQKPIRP